MERKLLRVMVVLLAVLALLPWAGSARAEIRLMDGRLMLNGAFKLQTYIRTDIPKNENDMFHKSHVDYMRTSFRIEALYHLAQIDDMTINLFGGFQYAYELMPMLDSKFKRAIPHRAYSEYIHTTKDDLITEAYVDIIKGPWQFRVGKQIVVWGETNLKRTADVINPLDLRFGSPGTEDWESLKLGLYMLRGIYQTDLPGQLNFEFLFIPGDFEMARIPIEGTHRGPSPADTAMFAPGRMFGITHWAFEKMRKDEPGWSLSNWELGLKVRGYTWDIDWSFFYFNTISDEAVADPRRANDFFMEYIQAGLATAITGRTQRLNFPGYRVYDFKRFEVLGATFQTVFESLPMTEWRLELFYEIGNHYNKAEGGSSSGVPYATVKRDTFGFGLEIRDRFTVPWMTHALFDDKKLNISLSYFYDKIANPHNDIVITSGRAYRPGDNHASTFSWSISQYAFHSQVFTMFQGTYSPIGKYNLVGVLGYAPGSHWRYDLGISLYGSKASKNKGVPKQDFYLIRVRYEF